MHDAVPDNELRALAMLKGASILSLVIVIFNPLKDTPLEAQAIPPVGKVRTIMQKAREMFPDTKLFLGCAKNSGPFQRTVEGYALEFGFDGIAYPSDGTIAQAQQEGRIIELGYRCCALG
jgi:uncharacterized radical SAM superfamily protein